MGNIFNVILSIIKSALGINNISDLATNIIKGVLNTDAPMTKKIQNIRNEVIKLTKNHQITDDKTMGYIQNAKARIEEAFYNKEKEIIKSFLDNETKQQEQRISLYTNLASIGSKVGIYSALYFRPWVFLWFAVTSFVIIILTGFFTLNEKLADSYIYGSFTYCSIYIGAKSYDMIKGSGVKIKDLMMSK